MSGDEKEKGDAEYREGYKAGRDGDPATRLFDSFFGYTNSDTTYGKGYQAGREDKYEYGSSDTSSATKTSSNSKSSNSRCSNAYSSHIGGSSSSIPGSTKNGLFRIVLFVVYVAISISIHPFMEENFEGSPLLLIYYFLSLPALLAVGFAFLLWALLLLIFSIAT